MNKLVDGHNAYEFVADSFPIKIVLYGHSGDDERDLIDTEPSKWCIEHFGQQMLDFTSRGIEVINPSARWDCWEPHHVEYFFRNEDDAILFKLRWQ